jgi:hypothetical protein
MEKLTIDSCFLPSSDEPLRKYSITHEFTSTTLWKSVAYSSRDAKTRRQLDTPVECLWVQLFIRSLLRKSAYVFIEYGAKILEYGDGLLHVSWPDNREAIDSYKCM